MPDPFLSVEFIRGLLEGEISGEAQAVELGPSDIRVNAILPGVVEGERMDRVIAARAESLGVSVEAMREEYLKKISLRRMVTVDDISAMALFLASPAALNITGQAISVDGNVEYL
jgi:NAD(P)-dependent dehydrogenase (short-subunit alcohol dehydrogenase family)